MQIESENPTFKNPAAQFAGDVWLDLVTAPHTDDQRVTVAIVRFASGARTAWHYHARGQYLRVTQGTGRFGTRDGKVSDVHPGQTIYFAPGEEHFHAAGQGCFMEHIAMLESGDDPATTTVWLEHITDEDYNGN